MHSHLYMTNVYALVYTMYTCTHVEMCTTTYMNYNGSVRMCACMRGQERKNEQKNTKTAFPSSER